MEMLIIDPQSVTGWGADADPENDPTYPYRIREHDDHKGVWARPPLQRSEVEVLQSIEHVRRPAVFGTSTPPSGLSGLVRRRAFRWSESNWLHWLLLMGADRINVVEGLVDDARARKLPNIPAEMGLGAEWRHNKQGLATNAGIAIAAGTAVLMMMRRRRRKARRAEIRRRVQPSPNVILLPPPGSTQSA